MKLSGSDVCMCVESVILRVLSNFQTCASYVDLVERLIGLVRGIGWSRRAFSSQDINPSVLACFKSMRSNNRFVSDLEPR